MRDSLRQFINGVSRRWWFWVVTVLSSVTTFTGLYYPRSLVERSVLDLAPALGITIFIGAFFVSAYFTYKELYDATVKCRSSAAARYESSKSAPFQNSDLKTCLYSLSLSRALTSTA